MPNITLSSISRERRFQGIVTGGLVMVFSLTALAPNNQRALFVDDFAAPSAFSAVEVPEDTVVTVLRRFAWVPRQLFGRVFAPPTPLVRQPAAPGTIDSATPGGGNDFADAATAGPPELTGDAGTLEGPTAGGGYGGGVPGGGLPVAGGGGYTGPQPVATPTPVPVTPVPEPTTWMLLVLGFGVMAVGLRRTRRPEPAAA